MWGMGLIRKNQTQRTAEYGSNHTVGSWLPYMAFFGYCQQLNTKQTLTKLVMHLTEYLSIRIPQTSYLRFLIMESAEWSVTRKKRQRIPSQLKKALLLLSCFMKEPDISCKSVISSGSTGDISLNNVIAAEKFSIERSTGDVNVPNSITGGRCEITADTGDIKLAVQNWK